MLSFDQTLKGRRSIREYSSQIPSAQIIREIVQASLYYPSPSGSHPVRYFQISNLNVRNEIHATMTLNYESMLDKTSKMDKPRRIKNYIKAYWRYSEFMLKSPVLLAAGLELPKNSFSDILQKSGLSESGNMENSNYDIALGASLMAFQMKAKNIGLGSCILTAPLQFLEDSPVLSHFDIPVSCFISLGYPNEEELKLINYNVDDFFREV